MGFETFVKYGEIGLVVATLAVLVYVFKTFMDFIKQSNIQHENQRKQSDEIIEKSIKVSEETYQYLKMQNGSFKDLMREVRDTVSHCPTNLRKK